MQNRYLIQTAYRSLRRNLSRSLLTVLGIVIGITAIILVASLGKGAKGIIVGELSGLGADTLVLQPGKQPKGPSDFADSLLSDSIKDRELVALALKHNVPDLIDFTPEVFVGGSASYEGETYKPMILGNKAEFMVNTLDLVIEEGVVFDDRDIRAKARVAVIGAEVRKELFGEASAIGKYIQVKGQKFRVVGQFAEKGSVVFFDVDKLLLVPYTTAQAYLTGNDYYNEVILQAGSPEAVPRVVYDVEQTMRELHRIEDPSDDDFHVETQQGLVEQVSTIINIFTMFLSFVVAISLVVGGIGVMNIMLVSVTERTREVGLRKALGATDGDILKQFLLEAIFLTSVGGIIGIVLGSLLAYVAALAVTQFAGLAMPFMFPWVSAIVGTIVSAGVGVVFGLYPARKASKLSPMEALRFE